MKPCLFSWWFAATLRCVAGLETPDSGRISIAGRVVYDSDKGVNIQANQRNVGMVFQTADLPATLQSQQVLDEPLVVALPPDEPVAVTL